MPVAVQIRDVPDDVRDAIADRAAERGQSLQAYLLDVLRREARIAANAKTLVGSAASRVVIPEDLRPERIVRDGRTGGFDADRDRNP